MSSKVSVHCLKRMCSWDGVKKIYLDGIKKTSLYIATPSIGSTVVQKKKGLTGKGINIAIIDTGVYPHPDLTRPVNRIVAFKDWVNHKKRPYDDNGHGTHVAGDAAGNGWVSKGKYKGPAPKAGIVGVKVLDKDGNGFDSTIIKGIEWCISNRKRLKLRILSMSFGGPMTSPCKDDPLCQAVEKAVKAGLIVVVAAGNSGPGRRTIESPGNSPLAITIGAVDDRRTLVQADDRITSFSSRGPTLDGRIKPDIVAPGETIISLRAPCSQLDREFPFLRIGKKYFVLSGTSMSTPIVSGAAAQLLQCNPSLSPKQVKEKLKRNTFRLKLGPNTGGSGEINVRFLQGNKRHPKV
ncbi:serine protease AprX [Paenibacillus wynnii]|nr:serine protease AprX [Paenibacillus wynnii]